MIYEHDEGMTFEIIILRLSCLKRKYHKDPHRGAKCWCLDVTDVFYGIGIQKYKPISYFGIRVVGKGSWKKREVGKF